MLNALVKHRVLSHATFGNAKEAMMELSDDRFEPNGAYVFRATNDLEFERFDTIGQAVRYAIDTGGKAKVLCRGKEIKFVKLNNMRGYFIDFDGQAKLVELG